MRNTGGATPPFFLGLSAPRLRDDALLQHALAAFHAGHFADALLAVEYLCRVHPTRSPPAILRAKLLAACRPELAPKAWYRAWCCDPEHPLLQDLMLQAWLASGAAASVAELGPAFLPARCRAGTQASLLALLAQAGVLRTGACWRHGDFIDGMLFDQDPAAAPMQLQASDEHGRFDYAIRPDGARFRIACPRPQGAWSLCLAAAGTTRPALLPGSPLVWEAAPAAAAAPSQGARPVALIIPVYRDRALVRACIASVLASLPHNRSRVELVVIDDASPEPALAAWLDEQAGAGRLTLLRNRANLGFIETVNRGLRLRPAHDALLLNADTLVHGDWIDRLGAALYSAPDIASATPWSNNAEISSFPAIGAGAQAPDAQALSRIDELAAAARRAGLCADEELPSCCGFAMLMRRSAIDSVGLLDGVGLVRGYGEEVDWCLRARSAGLRHLLATGVFVAHAGSVSFRFEKTLRVRQNRQTLAARYPDFYAEYRAFLRDDPLAQARSVLADALLRTGSAWLSAVTLRMERGDAAARALPPPLPSSCTRIAVWRHRMGTPQANQVLALARAMAARGPGLRLLVVGEASEALWHTGVVDVLPASHWEESALFADAALVGLGACQAILSAPGHDLPPGLPHVRLDARFDAQAWLAGFAPAPKEAA